MTEKQILRKGCWRAIREAGAARFPGVEGRIPNFVGAEQAARSLSETVEFQNAATIKCNPDSPQRPVRHLALVQGKTVYMAAPKLREAACFLELDPSRIGSKNLWKASSAKGALALGRPMRPEDLPKIDLIVSGCVGAGRDGVRLGKGGGYADLEYAILLEAGRIAAEVIIATTVHPCQLLPAGMAPRAPWDLSLDIVAMPKSVLRIPNRPDRLKGIQWSALSEEKIAAIPQLAHLRSRLES